MAEERYYTLDDPEYGVTHEQLRELDPEKQREYMLAWFARMFEDPANETPYQSSEGGYLYIWGGPYDARDQIESQFYDVVDQKVIDEVIDDVESDGISDWAPGAQHPDHARASQEYHESMEEPAPKFEDAVRRLEAGEQPILGFAIEREIRKEIRNNADNILQILASRKPEHGGIGHNKPPTSENEYAIAVIIEQVRDAASSIATETSNEAPDALEIATASSKLAKLIAWSGSKVDVAAHEFAKNFGKATGAAVGVAFGALLITAISKLLGFSWDWLSAILPSLQ